MLRGFTGLLLSLAACAREPQKTSADSAAAVSILRAALVQNGIEDQAGRDSIAVAVANNDTAFAKRIIRADSSRSRWLQTIIADRGWPRRSIVGDSAAAAAWMIVQHSPSTEFQESMLPVLEQEAKRGEVKPADVAMLSDRVRVHRKRPQRYGTQFSVQKTKLIADSIADLNTLDSLRASVGLPPMKEYVRLLAEMYRMPVEWPPSSRQTR